MSVHFVLELPMFVVFITHAFSVGTIPAVEEEEFVLLNTTEPDILNLNMVSGMVSLQTGETLLGVDSINFTVIITRTDNDTCKLRNVIDHYC